MVYHQKAEVEYGANTLNFDVSNMESGVYYIQVKNGEKQVIDKFIISR